MKLINHMAKASKSKWKKQIHTWHWVSSAISLICMMLFSITGITLNHAELFESDAAEKTIQKQMPDNILRSLIDSSQKTKRLTEPAITWINTEIGGALELKELNPEWNDYEIYIQKPIPGGDKWLSLDLQTGEMIYNHSNRGVIAWLNDLHKGRNTHVSWIWFIDIFSIATLVFCITGLVLLHIHAKRRPLTWYITGAGIVFPGIIAFFYL